MRKPYEGYSTRRSNLLEEQIGQYERPYSDDMEHEEGGLAVRRMMFILQHMQYRIMSLEEELERREG